jgi:raffinose/stachyose/melibiose transport system substrate-binding protein
VPVASVIHGFIYNADVLRAVGAAPPATWDDFFKVLHRLQADGRWIPLVLGTKDGWETATMGYQNIGPDFYRGEEGRMALLAGGAKLTDPSWVQPWRVLAQWRPFLGEGFEAQTYPDSQNLFMLGLGAIYPSGSWEIGDFEKQAKFRLGVFKPPLPHAGDKCYISDHPDLALGANAAGPHLAQSRIFLDWVGSPEFATLYANALPGFFSLSSAPVTLASPLAREFLSWRSACASTIRPTAQFLSRGTPNLEREFWRTGAAVIDGTIAPEAAAQRLEAVLEQTRQQLRKEHP